MYKNAPQITCIGVANVDVISAVDEQFIQSHNIAAGASTLLDAQTTGMILGKLNKPSFAPGGVAANTSCGLADHGINVLFVGKTGDDVYGEIFRDGFKDRSITMDSRAFTPQMTSTCLTLITPDKDRSFAFCADTAGWQIFPHDLPDATEYVYLEANTAHMPPLSPVKILNAAVEKYEAAGSKIIINLNDREMIAQARPLIMDALSHKIYFLICNKEEFCALFDTNDASQAWEKAQQSGRNYAITDGHEGVRILFEGKMLHVPAQKIAPERIINTLGAGDQFAAGFIAALIKGVNIEDAAKSGIVAASKIIQNVTARPPLPSGNRQAS
jgi:sugar/nucleoside kinase (ribokinase family)